MEGASTAGSEDHSEDPKSPNVEECPSESVRPDHGDLDS